MVIFESMGKEALSQFPSPKEKNQIETKQHVYSIPSFINIESNMSMKYIMFN